MFFLFLLVCVVYADVSHESSGTTISVLGQSGKVRITRETQEWIMQVDFLSEVDQFNNVVGVAGQDKHSVNSFATQSFTFTPLVQRTYKNTSVKEFTFQTPIYTIGKLKLVTMIMDESASIGTETETWSVSPGDMKWNIQLSEWTFCNPCLDGTAAYVDIGIEIKGDKNEVFGNKTVDLGGATLQLSNRVIIDNQEMNMPDSYPKLETRGSKQLYIFRFPKFNTGALYDPLLQLSENTNHGQRMKYSWLLLCYVVVKIFILL